jgi:hypothetical protein
MESVDAIGSGNIYSHGHHAIGIFGGKLIESFLTTSRGTDFPTFGGEIGGDAHTHAR